MAVASRVQAIASLYAQELDGPEGASAHEVNLGAYLARVGDAVGGLSAGVTVRVDAAPSVTMASDGAARLGLVLSELITNAVQHAYEPGEPGEVRITLEREGDGLRLQVVDGGCGMGESDGAGTGLGGMIVRDLVRRLGGSLDHAPGPDGDGTCVSMRLPYDRTGGRDAR